MPGSTTPPIVINGGASPLKTVLAISTIGLLGFGAWELKKYLDKVADANNLKKDQDSTITSKKGKPLFDLNGKPVSSANLGMIAADLNNTLSSFLPVDNDRVVRVFQSTPYGYVSKLEQFYLDRYGKQLRQQMVDRMSDAAWIKIKFNFK